ncbi:hypothetical protein [Streptomyces sp. TLI_171]|uniref:hypothetical protein n=1 Tax=Streptomyces sp. TLI_171 TaxID=1938859 RepID=UPI000C17668D|nr:hypothetical protein [Streptomyces sp. TLI_171]RKE18194.1 hypothetical protein BX266_1477 [Streptomyces sp. TLI_171]
MISTGRTFLAATAVVLALTATACAGKGGGGDAAPTAPSTPGSSSPAAADLTPAAVLKLVGEKTGAAKSAKVEATTDFGATKATMTGAITWEHGLQGELSGAMGGTMAENLAKLGGDGTFTARYLSDAMYINMGDAMAAQLGGAHWIKYAYADLAKVMGPAGDSLKNQLQNADPVTSVRALIATGKATEAGTESVNGSPATKYTADLSLTDVGQAASQGLTQEQAEGLKQQFTTAGITTDHIEVWVAADNLLVKKVEQFQTKTGLMSSTAVYSDYGTPVETGAPFKTDVVDFAEILAASKNGG